jgi:ribose transport system substrate-binding protein
MRKTGGVSLLAVLALLALAVAGCGSSSSDSTGTSSSQSGDEKQVVAPPPETPPTEIAVTAPLAKAPPEGKTFLWMQCELPVCDLFRPGVEEATEALGWNFKSINYSNANPGASMTQAIQQKPDYIAISGIPAALMTAQLAEAKKAGIPVIGSGQAEKPSPETFVAIQGSTLQPDAEYIGRWAINDSDGKANILGVNTPEFPVLADMTQWFKDELTGLCGECSYEELPVTVEDLGAGKVGSKVASALQKNPDINYVFYSFTDVATGVPEALQAAGLSEKVKQVGAVANSALLKEIGGTQEAWTIQGQQAMGWTLVDTAARLANGEKLPASYQKEIEVMPSYVISTPEQVEELASTGDTWTGPGDFAKQYEELWQLNG